MIQFKTLSLPSIKKAISPFICFGSYSESGSDLSSSGEKLLDSIEASKQIKALLEEIRRIVPEPKS